jgi:hypothetical protein
MAEAAINDALTSIREAQAALSQLKKDLSAEPNEEALRKWIAALGPAEDLVRSLVSLLQSHESPAVERS